MYCYSIRIQTCCIRMGYEEEPTRVEGMSRHYHPPLAPWYREYLSGEHWLVLRDRILTKRGYQCQDCGSTWGRLTLHHLTYVRIGHEREADLRILCSRCHREVHRLHDIPFLFLVYWPEWKERVVPILQRERMAPNFDYPRFRRKGE